VSEKKILFGNSIGGVCDKMNSKRIILHQGLDQLYLKANFSVSDYRCAAPNPIKLVLDNILNDSFSWRMWLA